MQRAPRHIQDGEHHECPYVTTFVSRIFSLENSMRKLSLEMLLILIQILYVAGLLNPLPKYLGITLGSHIA
jgi:hypothetical protein